MDNHQKEQLDVVRPHVHDDIEEYDNPLPRWWVNFFYFTIVFSFVYMAYYHFMGGPSTVDEMQADLKAQSEAVAASGGGGGAGEDVGATLVALIQDQSAVGAGQEIYKANCSPCHGQAGEGVVGPNLTDKFWLHGGKPEEIYKSIADGIVEKGMIAWMPILGGEKVKQVTAYVSTLKGTNPANAKAPEGEPVE